MKSIALILVLIAGVVSGYFLGDYRGKQSRIALEKAVEAGRVSVRERDASVASLKRDLESINGKYTQDIAQLGMDYEKRTAEWEHTKSALDDTIGQQSKKLSDLNGELTRLMVTAGAATGADKKQVEKKIEVLSKTIASLRGNMDANLCLKMPVPLDVLKAIGQIEAGEQ